MSSSSCPPNYVFGVGRGATGFTTRSNIGPDRSPTSIAVSGLGRGNRKGPEEDDLDEFEEPNSSNRFNCSLRRARNHVVDEARSAI
ncbi:pre-mRNA splicing factor-like protein [Cinnamomum micranthum f. kanehirae]|uniref:Pre-mRNA splicing factor-like protein n=1 Tax=Cinnamomum micranthum f. kanehirae TaxID=337451 RepID=A0A443PTW2_9MAGN|nr:pre-mRNA splicing factor-like protein [Cinnamomum micranthum f. kanehirae]